MPSERIVHAVAEERGVDPLALPPLYDVLDPDALDKLFTASETVGRSAMDRVIVTVADCEVVVCRDGSVEATALDDAPEDPSVAHTEIDLRDETETARSD